MIKVCGNCKCLLECRATRTLVEGYNYSCWEPKPLPGGEPKMKVLDGIEATRLMAQQSGRAQRPLTTLSGEIVSIAGVFPTLGKSEIREMLRRCGVKISIGVHPKVTVLVAGDKAGSKLEKAIKLGIRIIDEGEFIDAYNLQYGLPNNRMVKPTPGHLRMKPALQTFCDPANWDPMKVMEKQQKEMNEALHRDWERYVHDNIKASAIVKPQIEPIMFGVDFSEEFNHSKQENVMKDNIKDKMKSKISEVLSNVQDFVHSREMLADLAKISDKANFLIDRHRDIEDETKHRAEVDTFLEDFDLREELLKDTGGAIETLQCAFDRPKTTSVQERVCPRNAHMEEFNSTVVLAEELTDKIDLGSQIESPFTQIQNLRQQFEADKREARITMRARLAEDIAEQADKIGGEVGEELRKLMPVPTLDTLSEIATRPYRGSR